VDGHRVTLTINLPLAFVLALMGVLHLLVLFFQLAWLPQLPSDELAERNRPLNVREIRTIGERSSKLKDKVLVTKDQAEKAKVDPLEKADPFKTLAQMNRPNTKPRPEAVEKLPPRPSKPDPRPSALDQLAMRAEPVQKVASRTQHGGAAMLGGSPTLTKSLMNMQVEVPEGVSKDELNEFELKFYGFQKRMMEKYFSTIVLQAREYEKRYSLPVLMPDGRHVMTGRVTFDSDGNIKQIKMIRWTQADKLQNMFEDVLKAIDTLPNPPRELMNQHGEFVVYYTFTVNNL